MVDSSDSLFINSLLHFSRTSFGYHSCEFLFLFFRSDMNLSSTRCIFYPLTLYSIPLRLTPILSFFFFGGLSIPVSQAILAHLFSYNITWSATVKEVQRSNFFKEIPKIIKRFWFQISFSVLVIAGMIVCSTKLVPLQWRVDGSAWAVIFPLAYVSPRHLLRGMSDLFYQVVHGLPRTRACM